MMVQCNMGRYCINSASMDFKMEEGTMTNKFEGGLRQTRAIEYLITRVSVGICTGTDTDGGRARRRSRN